MIQNPNQGNPFEYYDLFVLLFFSVGGGGGGGGGGGRQRLLFQTLSPFSCLRCSAYCWLLVFLWIRHTCTIQPIGKSFSVVFVLIFLNDIYLLLLLLVVIVAFIPQLIVLSHVSLRRYDKKRSQQLTTNTMNMELISLTESLWYAWCKKRLQCHFAF